MKTVFIVVREYDLQGYRIAGIYESRADAAEALLKNDEDGYGMKDGNRIEEIELNTYFDIGEIGL
ncbi:hypothetical protein [Litorivivens sp.]|uniref:hypothetical protein n=1 Tax=Litorivivens sp. TaxID=2020868 RepID=UPI00356A0F9A